MASQPVKREMVLALAAKGRELIPELPDNPDDAALAYVCALLEQGTRISHIAPSVGVSRFLLDRWIRGDKERQSQVLRARALGADALVDEGGDLLDSATRDTIAVANARAGWRKWLASKYDPTTYGEGSSNTGVTIGSLHLHAALSRPPIQGNAPPALGPIVGAVERGYPTEAEPHPTESKALGTGEIVVDPSPSHSQTPPSTDSVDKG